MASTSSGTTFFIARCLSLPNILTSHLGAWACRRHIISILLKSLLSIEHLRCSFENSKTVSFHKISVNFVILKQIQKIHTQWLRQAQPPNLLLHGAWACRRQHQKNLIISSPHHQEKFHTQWLRQAQPPNLLLHAAWASRRHITSIVLKSVRSIEHLRCSFEKSKTPSFHKISVNFVLLKQIQKIHTQWLRQAQPPNLSLHGAWA